jgi:hypothetical protein
MDTNRRGIIRLHSWFFDFADLTIRKRWTAQTQSKRRNSCQSRMRSEPVNDARFPDIVRRHLHPYSISHGQTNIPLSHFPGNMGKNKVLIGKLHPKHCSREDGGNSSFNDD